MGQGVRQSPMQVVERENIPTRGRIPGDMARKTKAKSVKQRHPIKRTSTGKRGDLRVR